MKKILIVLIESFVLTVFVTLMSQAYVERSPGANCRNKFLSLKKCVSKVEASGDSLP